MGKKGILVCTIIAGIAVMLVLSSIPAYADHSGGHNGKCPGKWTSVDIPSHPADANGNDVVCRILTGAGFQMFMDDILHPNNP